MGKALHDAVSERFRTTLRELMSTRGWDQTRVAAEFGIKQQSVSQFLSGRNGASLHLAWEIAKAAGTPMEEILSGGSSGPPEPRTAARRTVFDMVPVAAPAGHDVGSLERALFAAMDGTLHEPADFDIAREVVRAGYRFFPVEVPPQVIAEQLLAAASSLREDGLEVTITSVLARSHPVDESARSATRPKVVLESSG